jgi:hypothetical protein
VETLAMAHLLFAGRSTLIGGPPSFKTPSQMAAIAALIPA